MKRLIFFVVFILFAGSNSVVVSFATDKDNCDEIDMPIGDSEENSGEETKNVVEEDDDEVGIDHLLLSRGLSCEANLHFLFQETLFNSLEIEVIIPPPKA